MNSVSFAYLFFTFVPIRRIVHQRIFQMQECCPRETKNHIKTLYYCIRMSILSRIDMFALAYHIRKVDIVFMHGMHCSKHFCERQMAIDNPSVQI